jgi:hypothetical protein
VAALEADPALAFVHSAAEVLVEDSAPRSVANVGTSVDYTVEGGAYFRRLLLGDNPICAPSVVARRTALRQAGDFDAEVPYACDYLMWMKLCTAGGAAYLARPLIRYRWHGNNGTHRYDPAQRLEQLELVRRRALDHYRRVAGRQEEANVLESALEAVIRANRIAFQLEGGKVWLEQQCANWQQAYTQMKQQSEHWHQAWAQLEEGKAWLEQQRANWQQAYTQMEQQSTVWQEEVRRREETVQALQEQLTGLCSQFNRYEVCHWFQLGIRLRALPPPKG